jgi:hypothetical protein
MSDPAKAAKQVGGMIITAVVVLLITGALLATDAVQGITWINMTLVQSYVGAFFIGLLALLGLAGTAYGIAFAVKAFKGLIGKNSEIGS